MGVKRPQWYRQPLYAFFVIARRCIPCLPLRVVQLLGQWLGLLAYLCLRQQRQLAMHHLTQAYGEQYGPAQRRHIVRCMFQHLGMNGLEWLAFPQFTAQRMQHLIRCEGMHKMREAQERGKGIIVISAHYGNWELLAAYFGMLGLRGGVVARRLRYPEYESWLIAMRREKHVATFLRDTGWRELIRALNANHSIGIMPDQDVDSVDGTFVEFFGRPAFTPTGPTLLAMQTGAALLPAFIVREGYRFRIVIHDPVPLSSTGDRARDVRETTQAWTRVTEEQIRAHPDHWVWMHRRWKTARHTHAVA